MIPKEQLLDILAGWNRWGGKTFESGFRRRITDRISDFLFDRQIVSLTGVRRSGKSTLMFQLIDELVEKKAVKPSQTLYVNFEEPLFSDNLSVKLLQHVFDCYRETQNPSGKSFLFLDEIQNVPAWEKWVRTASEKENIKIFVTGSSSKLLAGEFSTLLTGRHFSFTVYPLLFQEFLAFQKKEFPAEPAKQTHAKATVKNSLREYMRHGAFPAVALLKQTEKKNLLLRQYFDDILFKDIALRHQIRDLRTLRALAFYYQTNISSLSSYNRLRHTLQLPLELVRHYTSFLAEAYLIEEIPKFAYKIKEQIINPKKIYTIDWGLRNAVAFRFSEDIGRIAENIVLHHLRKPGLEIYYYRGKQEVDFVTKQGTKIREIIQVAYPAFRPQTQEREIAGLREAMHFFGLKEGLLLTEDHEETLRINEGKIKIAPLWKWLLA